LVLYVTLIHILRQKLLCIDKSIKIIRGKAINDHISTNNQNHIQLVL
jgi:hypothetical protein